MADRSDARPAPRRRRRPRLVPRRHGGRGAAPGQLVADPEGAAPQVRVIRYDHATLEEREPGADEDAAAWRDGSGVLWIDVAGLGDAEAVRRIGAAFGLHGLALEDVVSVSHRPKVEEYDDHLFIVVRVPEGAGRPGGAADRATAAATATEQLSLFLGDGFLLSFHETDGAVLEPVRERLRQSRGRIRDEGADYLAYAVIDAAVDAYFPVLERYGEAIEALEDEVIARPAPGQVDRLHGFKRDLLALRRAVWPLREVLNELARDEGPFFGAGTCRYLRDCYDHAIELLDVVETYREVASGLLDVYLSSMSTRLNEVMKVLTIISTIFIPLGFLASLYGMNFDRDSPWNMPELGLRFGYPLLLLAMAVIAGFLLLVFKRRGWIGRAAPEEPGS